ncbi:MAG TPA: hypothetical protein VIT42_06105, partial [Microlunatus sp.]
QPSSQLSAAAVAVWPQVRCDPVATGRTVDGQVGQHAPRRGSRYKNNLTISMDTEDSEHTKPPEWL